MWEVLVNMVLNQKILMHIYHNVLRFLHRGFANTELDFSSSLFSDKSYQKKKLTFFILDYAVNR